MYQTISSPDARGAAAPPRPVAALQRWLSQPSLWGLSRGLLAALALAAAALALSLSLALRPPPAAPPPAADECSWPSYRLPLGRVQPLSYAVFWDLSSALAAPFPFTGSVEAQLQLVAGVRCVLLHSKGLALTSVTAAVDAPGSSSVPLAHQPDPLPFSERVILALPQALQGPQRLRLRVLFSGSLSNTAIGFYASTYANGSLAVPLVQTKFEPAFARTAFPCLDEPALKANFSLALAGVPPGYTALSNMPALGPVEAASGAVTFATSPAMSTYQLTAVVAPMRSVAGALSQGGSSIPFTCWTMDRGSASYLPGCAFASATGIAALAYYSDALGVPYPLPKMDLVYLPVFPVGGHGAVGTGYLHRVLPERWGGRQRKRGGRGGARAGAPELWQPCHGQLLGLPVAAGGLCHILAQCGAASGGAGAAVRGCLALHHGGGHGRGRLCCQPGAHCGLPHCLLWGQLCRV